MLAIYENIGAFWSGLLVTLELSGLSLAISLPLGTLLATMRVSPVSGLRVISTFYVEIARNTPLTVVFFFSAFVLPQLGVRISYFGFAIIALSSYYTAFFCEAVRSGINAVPIGQAEAARSIGLSFAGSLRYVIVPQALRTSIPPLVNVVIALVKSSAVASAFGVAELLSTMGQLANRESDAVIAILTATAVIFLAITIPLGLLASYIEKQAQFSR